MKHKIKQYRQGDVLLERVQNIPETATKAKPEYGRVILAYGEMTGHHHSIDADAADWWKDAGGDQFVEVKERTGLVHQEHSKIALTPGKYRVVRQREYSPEAIRRVAD